MVEKIENDPDYLKSYFDSAINILIDIIKKQEDITKDKIVSFTNFFKNNSTDSLISNYLNN